MDETKMHNDFIIRIATVVDLSALVKVSDQLFDHKIKPHRAKEFLEDPRHHMLLAYNHGKVVGMVSGFQYVHPDKDPQLFISEVGVIPELQNMGIGRSLVKHMVEHGKNLGCVSVWVSSEASNQAAIHSYVAAGGVQDPEPVVVVNFNTEV